MLVRKTRMLTLMAGSIVLMGALNGCVISGPDGHDSSTCAEQEAIANPCDAPKLAGRSSGGKGDGSPENDGLQNIERPVGAGSDTGDDGEDTGGDQEP